MTKHKKIVDALLGLDPYYKALGEFVYEFAKTERTLLLTLWTFSGASINTSKALLHEYKIDGASKAIRRLIEVNKWPDKIKNNIEAVLKRLGEINDLRNSILHFGISSIDGKSWETSKSGFVIDEAKANKKEVSPEILDAASHDVRKIRYHLSYLAWGENALKSHPNTYHEVLDSAWLYKYVQQHSTWDLPKLLTLDHPPETFQA